MGWAVGERSGRDIGYGVPASCDHPGCGARIDRGLGYACGDGLGDSGCGLYFCPAHTAWGPVDPDDVELEGELAELCERCRAGEEPFEPTPDLEEWVRHKLTDETWSRWREENELEVARLRELYP